MAGLAIGLTATLGCAGGHHGAPSTAATIAESGLELPSDLIGSRRLVRAEYDGPEGSGTIRLVLQIHDRESFTIAASDRLGRALWTVGSTSSRSLWVDHREQRYCRRLPTLPLPGLGQADAGLVAAVALLSGVVPAPTPVQVVDAETGDGRELRDRDGRKWTTIDDPDGLSGWTLWDDRGPVWWWRRELDGGVVSQRTEGRQLRYRLVATEPTAESTPTLEPPAEYDAWCAPDEDS